MSVAQGSTARKEGNMETQANESPHTLFWIAGIAVTVFSLAGIAAIMGWIPNSMGGPSDSGPLAKLDPPSAKTATLGNN